jgi:hypothetical protein
MLITALIKSLGPVKFMSCLLFLGLSVIELIDGQYLIEDFILMTISGLMLNDLYWNNLVFLTDDKNSSAILKFNPDLFKNIYFDEVQSIKFKGSLPLSRMLYSSMNAMIFGCFYNRSDLPPDMGSGLDPRLILPISKKLWSRRLKMTLFLISLIVVSIIFEKVTMPLNLERTLMSVGLIAWSLSLIISIVLTWKEKRSLLQKFLLVQFAVAALLGGIFLVGF